jgi:hypothetical protein
MQEVGQEGKRLGKHPESTRQRWNQHKLCTCCHKSVMNRRFSGRRLVRIILCIMVTLTSRLGFLKGELGKRPEYTIPHWYPHKLCIYCRRSSKFHHFSYHRPQLAL